jgi:copper(I)-binding protein
MRAFRFAPAARAAALAVLGILILGSFTVVRADPLPAKIGDLTILEAWARATPVKTGAAYVTIRNDGASPDQLVGAAAGIAQMAHLHTTKKENGVMEMRPVDGIDLPPHATVTLKPGGFHIMLMGLAGPLKAGDTFPLTLTFAKAGAATVDVQIKPAGSAGGGADSMGGMKMDDMNHGTGN